MNLHQFITTGNFHMLPREFSVQQRYVSSSSLPYPRKLNSWIKKQRDIQSFMSYGLHPDLKEWPEIYYYCFMPHAFEAMKDLLTYPSNEIYTLMLEEWPIAYLVRPAAAPTLSENPTYAEIAAHLPEGLHYFRKFEDTEFKLVTETFVERCQQLKFKGVKFHLRWDGEKSYPPVEHLSRAWLEEQIRKKGDL